MDMMFLVTMWLLFKDAPKERCIKVAFWLAIGMLLVTAVNTALFFTGHKP